MDSFEEAVAAEAVDNPWGSASSMGSTGALSGEVPPEQPQPTRRTQGAQQRNKEFKCTECKSVLKTEGGFWKHNLLHRITSANLRKPTVQDMMSSLDLTARSILSKLKTSVSEDLSIFIENVLKEQSGMNWVNFLEAFAEPILEIVATRKKVLPFHRYESQLMELNHFHNDKPVQDSLVAGFLSLNQTLTVQISSVKKLLYRFSTLLFEELLIHVSKEMRSASEQTAVSVPSMPANEIPAFIGHMEKLMKAHYKKGCGSQSRTMLKRSQCIRLNIFCSSSEDQSARNFLDPEYVSCFQLHPTSSDFFVILESFVRESYDQTENLAFSDRSDCILEKLIQPYHDNVMSMWANLTTEFLSETESLSFLKDVIGTMCTLSARLHVNKIKRVEESQKALQKHSLRTNLKRN